MARAADAGAVARCASCGGGLAFAAYQRGETLCHVCLQMQDEPGATFAPGPKARAIVTRPRRAPAQAVPDELLDELILSLQQSEGIAEQVPTPQGRETVREVLRDIGVGESDRELPWAAWGFALGFVANVGVAKYAQISTGATMTEFIPAFIVGGVVAGAACGAIGWAIARLKS